MNGYNLGNITQEAFDRLSNLDKTFIGTEHYMGVAYFWNYEYRHYLRDATIKQRVKVHAAMLKAELDPVGESQEHLKIILKLV